MGTADLRAARPRTDGRLVVVRASPVVHRLRLAAPAGGDRRPGPAPPRRRPALPRGFGPGSIADIAQFTLVQRARARVAVQVLSDSGEVESLEGPDGTALFDVPGALRPSQDVQAPPRLLAMWDSVLLAYADRGRLIPPGYRRLVTRSNGDVLPTVLVDGYVAGVWRPAPSGIEVTAFQPLTDETWNALATEARSLVALLADREPQVYRRYDHWWSTLPAAEVRVLTGDGHHCP
ncbi:crosslink repair DNA glycosylase YcaQ family protein [Oerskovia sp. M15]